MREAQEIGKGSILNEQMRLLFQTKKRMKENNEGRKYYTKRECLEQYSQESLTGKQSFLSIPSSCDILHVSSISAIGRVFVVRR